MSVAETNALSVLNAITAKQTVIAFLFNDLDESLPNLYATLPSIEEAMAIEKFLNFEPQWELEIEIGVVQKYLLGRRNFEWLASTAPAGLLSSIAAALLNLALPKTTEELNSMLNMTRASSDIYSQMKSLCSMNGNSSDSMRNLDVFQLLDMAVESEPMLTREGILESGFTIIQKEQDEKPGFIDFAKENRRMMSD